jgi:hypothetical protein
MKTSTATVRESLYLSRVPDQFDPKKIEIAFKIAELSNFEFDDENLCWSRRNDKMASENQTLCLPKVSNERFFFDIALGATILAPPNSSLENAPREPTFANRAPIVPE